MDTQQWTIVTVTKDLSRRWIGYFEVQPRFGENIGNVSQLLVRPAMGYRVNERLTLWSGYAWTPLIEPDFKDEHRLWQQALYEERRGKTRLSYRMRLEERFIEDIDETSFRLRNMVRLMYPISADQRWAAVAYDEVWINLNSTSDGPLSGFDQNWAFVGVNRQVNKRLGIETGYQMIHQNTPHTADNRRLDVWVVQVAFRL